MSKDRIHPSKRPYTPVQVKLELTNGISFVEIGKDLDLVVVSQLFELFGSGQR